MEKIFDFNHISPTLSNTEIEELKAFYKFYHKRWWLYEKAYKHYRNIHLLCNLGGSSLVIIGGIISAITMNPIILASISGPGLILSQFSKLKNLKKK